MLKAVPLCSTVGTIAFLLLCFSCSSVSSAPSLIWAFLSQNGDYKNGQRSGSGRIEQGLQRGRWEYWYDDGSRRAIAHFDLNRSRVQVESWYANRGRSAKGALVVGFRVMGSTVYGREGRWMFWNKDGSLDRQRSGVYTNDALTH